MKSIGQEINDKIPYHGSDVEIRKNDSSRMESSDVDVASREGRPHISSKRTKDSFNFDLMNSRLNSWRRKIHLDYFPPNN